MSEAAVKRNADPNRQKGRPGFKWYKIKNLNGFKYSVFGTLELHVAEKFNELGILWMRNIPIKYMNEYEHTYYPDFFLPELNKFVEVKGWFPDLDKIKMNNVIDQYNDIEILLIDKTIYKKFISGNLSFDQIPLYKKLDVSNFKPTKQKSSYFKNRKLIKEEKLLQRQKNIEQAKIDGRFKNGKILGKSLSINEWNNRKELILNSGVDLTKYGWVGKVSKITGLSKHSIQDVIDHFNNDINCFRRK